MNDKTFLVIGALLMALAVGFGAFGAHIVQDILTPDRFEVYETAVRYHFYNALGLLIVGVIIQHLGVSGWLKWSGYFLVGGLLIFSGSLYLLTLTDSGWLGAITPVGGASFILGWICLAVGIAKTFRINKE